MAEGAQPPLIGREEVRPIAEAYVAEGARFKDGRLAGRSVAAIRQISTADLNIYGEWPDTCWIAYVRSEKPYVVRSSDVLLISMDTGEVLYAGSASDEG